MTFWNDSIIKVLFSLGVVLSLGFLGWITLLYSGLPSQVVVEGGGGPINIKSGQLFTYPMLGLVTFIGSFQLARSVYRNNSAIAYRTLVASHFFQLFLIVLAIWAVRHF